MDVYVFRTNIHSEESAPALVRQLNQLDRVRRWTIDFGDRDKVLRVEAERTHPAEITDLLTSAGFVCEEMV
jgi:hypothetical protein